jgi:hypothetical protein
MKVIRCKWFPPKGFRAITILNYIIVRGNDIINYMVMNHESIHYMQERELAYAGFYMIYVVEFFCRLIQYRNWHTAYRNISFEREAYANQNDYNYYRTRAHYAWLNYIRR